MKFFATQDDRLLDRFISWRPDPSVIAVDAFMFSLKGENRYCFPPVSCISRLLREVLQQQVTITLATPDWRGMATRPQQDAPRAPSPTTDQLHFECRIGPLELETDMLSHLRVVLQALGRPKEYTSRW